MALIYFLTQVIDLCIALTSLCIAGKFYPCILDFGRALFRNSKVIDNMGGHSLQYLRSFTYLPPEWITDNRLYPNSDLYSAMHLLEEWASRRNDEPLRLIGLTGKNPDPSRREGHDVIVAKLRALLVKENVKVEKERRKNDKEVTRAEVRKALLVAKKVIENIQEKETANQMEGKKDGQKKEDVVRVPVSLRKRSCAESIVKKEAVSDDAEYGDNEKDVREVTASVNVGNEEKVNDIGVENEKRIAEVGGGEKEAMVEEVKLAKKVNAERVRLTNKMKAEKVRPTNEVNAERVRLANEVNAQAIRLAKSKAEEVRKKKKEVVGRVHIGNVELEENGKEKKYEMNDQNDPFVDVDTVRTRKKRFVRTMRQIGRGVRRMVRAIRAVCTRVRK